MIQERSLDPRSSNFSNLNCQPNKYYLLSKMMKQYLKFKWKQIIPKPDPTYGLPLPRSSHGVSILRNDVTKTTKLLVYGGEHMARTPMDKNEAASVWICDLTQVKSMLSSPSTTPKTSSIPTSKNEKEEEDDEDEEEEDDDDDVVKVDAEEEEERLVGFLASPPSFSFFLGARFDFEL